MVEGENQQKERAECGEGEDKVALETGESEAEGLKKENSELVNDLKRLQAEFENYQKRTEKEKGEASEKGRGAVLAKLIALADEFEAAEAHMHASSESELRNGIRLLHKKLEDLLEGEGVEPIVCLGKKFDPDRCDAVEMVESEGGEGVVAKEMRKGYIYNGRILRHAMVSVTRKPAEEEKAR